MLPLVDYHSQLDEALNINNSDSVFATLYYTDLINEQRAVALRNEYNKKRVIDPNVQQTIPCEDLELVDPHNCCVTVPLGCKILRTKNKIPNTIEFHHEKAITSVGPVVMTAKRFTVIDYSRVPYIGEGRTTKNAIYAFLYDNYVYVISKDTSISILKAVAIRGVFEDPTSLSTFINCATGHTCWTPDDIYPMNLWTWAYIKEPIVQQLLRKRQIPIDDDNNANDDGADGNISVPQQK
tara:strand:- start:903 stop:1616 length:714 start_codon:yes stop_codon:yes gene_type:complete